MKIFRFMQFPLQLFQSPITVNRIMQHGCRCPVLFRIYPAECDRDKYSLLLESTPNKHNGIPPFSNESDTELHTGLLKSRDSY